MLFSIVMVLAMIQLAFASPPAAQATYCYEDNLLRAFQHTPTPASSYCKTAIGYAKPTFIAATTYPPSRLSSACSCFSRFPTEPTSCPTASLYQLTGNSNTNNYPLNIIVTVDTTKACPDGGHVITNVCGTAVGSSISYTPGNTDFEADNCFPVNHGGFDLVVNSQGIEYNIYSDTSLSSVGAPYGVYDSNGVVDSYSQEFVSVACGTKCPVP